MFTDAEVDGQDVFASRLLLHGCCISLIDGMVEVVWLERMCLAVSIWHVIMLLMESCGPCTERPLRFESRRETHQAFDGMQETCMSMEPFPEFSGSVEVFCMLGDSFLAQILGEDLPALFFGRVVAPVLPSTNGP